MPFDYPGVFGASTDLQAPDFSGLIPRLAGPDAGAPAVPATLGGLSALANKAPVLDYEGFKKSRNFIDDINDHGLIPALFGSNDRTADYLKYLAGALGVSGAAQNNDLGAMKVRGYGLMQDQLTGGVPSRAGVMSGAMGAPAATPSGLIPDLVGGDAPPAGSPGAAVPSVFAPQSAAPPVPSAPPADAPGGQPRPLFNVASLRQQYQIAAATPGMEPLAANLMQAMTKGVPDGAYLGEDGGIYGRTGASQFTEDQSAAKARGEAPYRIAENLASQAGRAIKLEPGDTATTGFSLLQPYIDRFMPRGAGVPAAGGAAPPAAAPAATGPTGEGAPGASATGFPTQSMHGPNGSLQSPLTLEGATYQKTVLPKQMENAQHNYEAAQGLTGQLDMIDHNIELLNQSGWSSTGSGANVKMALFKGLNSLSTTLGMGTPFDPAKIASWEDFNKESTRMGFELAKTLGSREAQMIVQQAVSAVPNSENTYMGARLVSSSLRQAAQRQTDYYEFLTNFARSHGGSTMGADIAFNKANPVGNYTKTAIAGAIPMAAKELLYSDPDKYKADFDKKYGAGISNAVLQGK